MTLLEKRTFAGLTVSLVIGAFYVFMFCMIGSVGEEIPNLEAYTVPETQIASSSYDTSFLIQLENTEKEAELSHIDNFKAQGTETMTEFSMPETATEKAENTQVKTVPSEIKETSAPVTSEVTTAATKAVTVTSAEVTTLAVTAVSTEVTTQENQIVTVTSAPVTSVITTVTSKVSEEDDTGDAYFGEDEESNVNKNDLPSPKSLNNGDTVFYTYNGVRRTESAYDAVCKIVSAEMSSGFDEEALKAQAVATYSFLKYHNQRGSSPSVVMKEAVPTKIKNAVKDVYGIAIYYNGEIAQSVYCASTGGSSTSAKSVWGTNVPYLNAVNCEYDIFDNNYGVTKTFSENEVHSMVLNATGIDLDGDPEDWFEFLSASEGGIADGGYIGNMLIGGQSYYVSNGTKIKITGRVVRENIFNFKLMSAKFDISYSDGIFTFTTYGYGHGVGMSQNGANMYATYAGYDYYDILTHYYMGVDIH